MSSFRSLRSRAGAAKRAVLNREGALHPAASPDPAPPVVGIVEEFSRRLVVGWVSVPADARPTRVDLYLDGFRLTSTYATPDAAMSGINSALRRGAAATETAADPDAGLVHPWQIAPIPGPVDDRRNSGKQIRTFSFRVREIWPYVNKSTRISVRVGDQRLPITGHGMYLSPVKRGRKSVAELRALFDEGYLLSQYGQIQLSKQLDTEWQSQVMSLYDRVRGVLHDEFGYDLFFAYGTLLGAVREGGFIGHDVDFDAAFVSRHRTGQEAAHELSEIALTLIRQGLEVQQMFTALHVVDPASPDNRIDVFHTYVDEGGVWRFPFGVAGTTTLTAGEWVGTREVEFPGGRGLVPDKAEELVRHLYGDDWRQPKPGFNWLLDRTGSAPEGNVPETLRTKVYWANFYAHNSYDSGSTFFEFVQQRDDTPATVIDIGCGDGRDSRAFAAAGRTVLGLDQSPVGIEHATSGAEAMGLGEAARFRVCDVADVDDLGRALDVVGDSPGPALFYLRFFLHAIHECAQEALLDAVGSHARAGDLFAAEFRTDKDEQNVKVHTKHYRRFQNADAFARELEGRGWSILHFEEGTGLSPYRDEDPVLCRVIARRP
jgi:SAM-dependent methyltransferase